MLTNYSAPKSRGKLHSTPSSRNSAVPKESKVPDDIDCETYLNFHRLSTHIRPKHYTICIKPNIQTSTFEGCVSVQVEIKKVAKSMYLHAVDLNVSKVVWEDDVTGVKQEPTDYKIDAPRQQLKISFRPPLPPSKGCIRINYNGEIPTKKHVGMYHSKYMTRTGQEKLNIVTKFDSTEARKCFPCWDEPGWKATFDFSFILPRDLIGIFNMKQKVTYDHRTKQDLYVVEFSRTPPMSTFLLAFVLGEFDFLETTVDERITVRVYTPLGRKTWGQFALDTTAKMIPYFEQVFGVSYPLQKLDLVAVSDLASSALGHWGLILFRASRFLINEADSSGLARQIVARNLAHEIAHQWFGHLVTMDWWTNLWAFESYATFMEYVTVDHFFPEFDVWTQFLSDMYTQALVLDAFKSTHPINTPIHAPSEIRDVYDLVSYCKSAAIMRMLHRFVGDKEFKEGVHAFLIQFANRNASAEQFWEIMEEVSGKPVTEFMDSWTKQIGFPLLRVSSHKYDPNNRTITFKVTQEKFWTDVAMREGYNKVKNKQFLWMVPLTMTAASSPTKILKEFIMDKRSVVVELQNMNKDQWVKLNPGTYNYYRTKYPSDMLSQFMSAIRARTMPSMDRLGIICDLLALAQAGMGSAVEIFSLLESFSEEDNYLVWTQLDKIMETLDQLLYGTGAHAKYQSFGCMIMDKMYTSLGWEKPEDVEIEKPLTGKLRALILHRMVRLEHNEVLEEGHERFEAFFEGKGVISTPPELYGLLFKIGIKTGQGDTQRAFFKRYRESESMEERDHIAQALGYTTDENQLHDALAFAISEDVKMRDSLVIFKSVGVRKPGADVAWEFLKNNWSYLRNKFPAGAFSSQLIYRTTSHFTTEEKALDILDFFKERPFHGAERAVQQSVERIRMMDAWLKKDMPLIVDYLSSY